MRGKLFKSWKSKLRMKILLENLIIILIWDIKLVVFIDISLFTWLNNNKRFISKNRLSNHNNVIYIIVLKCTNRKK